MPPRIYYFMLIEPYSSREYSVKLVMKGRSKSNGKEVDLEISQLTCSPVEHDFQSTVTDSVAEERCTANRIAKLSEVLRERRGVFPMIREKLIWVQTT